MAAIIEAQEAQGFDSPIEHQKLDNTALDPRHLRTDLMRAHDGSLAQDEHGEFLSPSDVIHQTLHLSAPYVGETPTGKQVFVIAPTELRARHTGERIPLELIEAFQYARKLAYYQAVAHAAKEGLIPAGEARRQVEGRDPWQALKQVRDDRQRDKDQAMIWKGKPPQDRAPQARTDGMQVGAGLVSTALFIDAAHRFPKKDSQGRRFVKIGKALYFGVTGVTSAGLLLSACQPIPEAAPVVKTPMPEQFHPTVDQAKLAVASWMGIRVPLAEGKFGVFPPQAIFEVDPTDSTGQTLKTLSLLNPDGRTTDPNLRYAMGLALIPNEKTGEAVELPFLVQLGKNGEALMLGMFLDPAQSTEGVGVFRLNIIKDGQIRPVTQEVVVTKVAGGVIIELRDISDLKNIVTYHLVSTSKDVSLPSQQSAVPSQVPDNNWIDKVVAFMSAAGRVQAAEPATPEQLAFATPEPTAMATRESIPETGPFEPLHIPVTVEIPKDTYRLLGLSETDVVTVDPDRMRQVFLYISMMRENNWNWDDVRRMTPQQEQAAFDQYLQQLRTQGDSTFIMPDWKALKTLEGGDTPQEVFKPENEVDIRRGIRLVFKDTPTGMVMKYDFLSMRYTSIDEYPGLSIETYYSGPLKYPNGPSFQGVNKSYSTTYGFIMTVIGAPAHTTAEFRQTINKLTGGDVWLKADSLALRNLIPALMRGLLWGKDGDEPIISVHQP